MAPRSGLGNDAALVGGRGDDGVYLADAQECMDGEMSDYDVIGMKGVKPRGAWLIKASDGTEFWFILWQFPLPPRRIGSPLLIRCSVWKPPRS